MPAIPAAYRWLADLHPLPRMMREGLALLDTAEVSGPASNPAILQWAAELGGDIARAYRADSTAWCGLFVAHCIAVALPDEPLPINPLGARNWLKFGLPVEPTPGAVLVFWRGTEVGWSGHVGFFAGQDDQAYHVLGGNQSDRVSTARVAKTRFLGARWPRTAPRPQETGPRQRASPAAAIPLSTNEA